MVGWVHNWLVGSLRMGTRWVVQINNVWLRSEQVCGDTQKAAKEDSWGASDASLQQVMVGEHEVKDFSPDQARVSQVVDARNTNIQDGFRSGIAVDDDVSQVCVTPQEGSKRRRGKPKGAAIRRPNMFS